MKQLNLLNPYPNITNLIKKDIFTTNGNQIHNLCLLRAKKGIYLYKGTYHNNSVVIKYFEKEEDKREIQNYRILNESKIPTINVFAFGQSSIIMEDINLSKEWRLGVADDLQDIEIASSLAKWYFNFHEKGAVIPELDTLYCEYDSVTEANIQKLCDKLPKAIDTFQYILTHYHKLRKLITIPSYTLTYNDFYWTNFIVHKDKQAALMFDYNLLGKGYRYTDIRNICSSLSENACIAFVNEYKRLYVEKHGITRIEEEQKEEQIDKVVSCLFSLIVAFEEENFPIWADEAKQEALNGTLLKNAKNILNKSCF